MNCNIGSATAAADVAPAGPAAPAQAERPSPTRTVTYKTVATASGDPTELQLHIFTPPDHQSSEQRPAIVFFFGGGWINGSPSQFYPHCGYLASRGMVAMAADYRIKSRNNTSPRACVEDGKSAVRWIRQHAQELGIDPMKLAAGGGSAGGQVAAATGTTSGFEPGEDLSISSRPNALVLFNPVFDNGPTGFGHDRVQAYWREFSPLHNLSAATPPTIVLLGTSDRLIPVATAQAYQAGMVAHGGRCELHLYPDQPHGFFNYSHPEYYTKTVVAMDRFLASLGYLSGEPTLVSEEG